MAFMHVQLLGRELYLRMGKPEITKPEVPQEEIIVRTNHGGNFERSGSWFGFGRHVGE